MPQFGIENLRRAARNVFGSIPPFRQWLAELEAMRTQNHTLKHELRTSKRDLSELRAKWQVASDELQRVKGARILSFAEEEPLFVPIGHFYSPMPASEDLRANEDDVFGIPPAVRGIDLNEIEQVELLKTFGGLYSEQPFTSTPQPSQRFCFDNPNFTYPDAIALYCMIRHLQPKRIVEIGSGYSSCVMLDVNELFFNNSIECTFIDPYPRLLRNLIKPSDRERIQILGHKVQEVDVRIFRELGPSDILFIDSSHVSKTGSDVNYIFFKVLPLLAKGVHIHFHDIFYPFEYPREWVFEGRSWNEAYLLRAFLQYNRSFKIRFFTSYLVHKHRSVFESEMPLCLANLPGSLWLEKTTVEPALERIDAPTERRKKPLPRKIEPSNPEDSWLLGEGWYKAEADHCWMAEEATLRLAGPENTSQQLAVHGHSPHVGGVRLTAYVDDFALGVLQLEADGSMHARFPLPAILTGRPSVVIYLSVDRVHQVPGDIRKLGLSVTEIEIA